MTSVDDVLANIEDSRYERQRVPEEFRFVGDVDRISTELLWERRSDLRPSAESDVIASKLLSRSNRIDIYRRGSNVDSISVYQVSHDYRKLERERELRMI